MNLKGKKIVVTGGAGFIGSHIVDALVKEGVNVAVVDNYSTGKKDNLHHHKSAVTHYRVDITDYEGLRKAFTGAYAVVHHAAVVSVPQSFENPARTHSVNALGTLLVFLAARDMKVDRVVYASSSAVYGDRSRLPNSEVMAPKPLSPYGIQKLMNEFYGMIFHDIHGLKTIGLRYFNVFGPRQSHDSDYSAVIPKFIKTITEGKQPRIFGDGRQTRDFIFVEDVVRANIAALKTNKGFGEVYNIATGVGVSLKALVAELNVILGTKVKPKYESSRKGDIRHSYANTKKAQRVLGFKSKTSFQKGLRATVDYMRK